MHNLNTVNVDVASIEEAIKLLQDIRGYSYEKALTKFMESVSLLGKDESFHEISIMKKEKYLKQHPYRIYQGADGYWRTDVRNGDDAKRRTVRRTTKEALEDYLVKYYYDMETIPSSDKLTLNDVYPSWERYRLEETGVKNKTIRESFYCWNRFFKDSPIANCPISSIKTKDLVWFFRKLTKGRKYTKKCISNARGVLNGLFSYIVEVEMLDTNPLRDVNFKSFTYCPEEPQSGNVFSKADVKKLITYIKKLEPAMYELAIWMFFNLFIRIGELMALTWKDVDWEKREIYVHTQLLIEPGYNEDMTHAPRKQVVSDMMKGNMPSGYRHESLNDDAIKILKAVKKLNPDGEFIFMPYGRVMNTDRFNAHLKKCCEACGVNYRSSHKIRFTNASTAFNGKNLVELSEQMGHKHVSTTVGYLRDVKKNEDKSALFKNLGTNGEKDEEA